MYAWLEGGSNLTIVCVPNSVDRFCSSFPSFKLLMESGFGALALAPGSNSTGAGPLGTTHYNNHADPKNRRRTPPKLCFISGRCPLPKKGPGHQPTRGECTVGDAGMRGHIL